MADPRIIDISLDEQTIIWRNADVEQERRIAIFDLLEENHFAPQREHADGYKGPYKVSLRVEEGRLAIGIARENGQLLESVMRSEGHTPELQSLMRSSYAVFCLTKKLPNQFT